MVFNASIERMDVREHGRWGMFIQFRKTHLIQITLIIALALIVAACRPAQAVPVETTAPSITETPKTALIDHEFTLRRGEELTIAGENLTVLFETVNEDTRCPKAAICESAGWATIYVQAHQSGSEVADIKLILSPEMDANRSSYEGYLIQFVRLDPYPQTLEEKSADLDYRATFVVSLSMASQK